MDIESKYDRLVSIIVPVYNVEKYIVETMSSVRAQSYVEWELLLVNDCSTDKTVQVIEEYLAQVKDERICLINQASNAGAAKARNTGLEKSAGRYVAYLDSDDLWEPEKLEHQISFMRDKDIAFSFTGYEFADENGKGLGKIVHVPEMLNYRQALKNTTIFTTTVMFDSKKIAKDMLKMPEVKSEDTALWWKVLRNGYIAYGLDENLVRYRRAGKSLSSNKLEAIRRIWNLYRNVEGLGLFASMWNFCFWAVRAVARRV